MSSSKNENDDLLHVLGRIISHAPFQKEVRDKRLMTFNIFCEHFLSVWNGVLTGVPREDYSNSIRKLEALFQTNLLKN